jgi:antitoxin (DNA-binding transcriptional repressor) of toxin-antitoxin stability system
MGESNLNADRASGQAVIGRGAHKQVNVRDLRARLASYLEEAAGGVRIDVVSRGRVVAELRPPSPPAPRASTRGVLKGKFWFAPDWHEASDEMADLVEGSVI